MTDTPQLGPLSSKRAIAAIAALVVGVSVAGGYWFGVSHQSGSAGASAEKGRRVLYWYDPMVPDQHFDKPGKSPFMDMQLVARYEGDAPPDAGVRIDSSIVQNLGVRLATVTYGPVSHAVTAAGTIQFNGRNLAVVQSRAGGFVERSHGRAVGDIVAAGAPLVDLRVPEWTGAQAEYLALRTSGDAALIRAARQRLIMMGMPASLVARVEADGAPHPLFTVTAPISGAITSLDAREGMTITPGAAVATISGTSPIWLVVSVPQANTGKLKRGGIVAASLAAFPGEVFNGRIEAVLPAADAISRTVEVRIALANRDGRLRPGMTAQVQLSDAAPRKALLVPAEAVIRTGQRDIVITALGEGRFAPVEVKLGETAGEFVEIREGLKEGDRVAASGQFLIDSEASLSGVIARLNVSAPAKAAVTTYEATGRITVLDGQSVTLSHTPVPALSWPAMTMKFQLARADVARGFAVGDSVTFRFHGGGAGYVIEQMTKAERQP